MEHITQKQAKYNQMVANNLLTKLFQDVTIWLQRGKMWESIFPEQNLSYNYKEETK